MELRRGKSSLTTSIRCRIPCPPVRALWVTMNPSFGRSNALA
jgi:hypothetical protein